MDDVLLVIIGLWLVSQYLVACAAIAWAREGAAKRADAWLAEVREHAELVRARARALGSALQDAPAVLEELGDPAQAHALRQELDAVSPSSWRVLEVVREACTGHPGSTPQHRALHRAFERALVVHELALSQEALARAAGGADQADYELELSFLVPWRPRVSPREWLWLLRTWLGKVVRRG